MYKRKMVRIVAACSWFVRGNKETYDRDCGPHKSLHCLSPECPGYFARYGMNVGVKLENYASVCLLLVEKYCHKNIKN